MKLFNREWKVSIEMDWSRILMALTTIFGFALYIVMFQLAFFWAIAHGLVDIHATATAAFTFGMVGAFLLFTLFIYRPMKSYLDRVDKVIDRVFNLNDRLINELNKRPAPGDGDQWKNFSN